MPLQAAGLDRDAAPRAPGRTGPDRWTGRDPRQLRIDAHLQIADGRAHLVHIDLGGPREDVFRNDDSFWLDLSLNARPQGARARFVDRWAQHRFQRLGSVCLFPPGEPLLIRSEGGVQHAIICEVRAEAVSRWLERDFEWSNAGLEAALNVSDAHVRDLLARLAREMRKPGFGAETLVELIMGQLSLEIGRYCRAADEGSTTPGTLAAWRLRAIDERLEDVSASPSLTELAELCGLSARQLSRAFRASRGASIGDYVAEKRLEVAKRRLAGPDSVKDIAHQLGFAAPSIFIAAFRRQTGTTPGEYRLQIRGH